MTILLKAAVSVVEVNLKCVHLIQRSVVATLYLIAHWQCRRQLI